MPLFANIPLVERHSGPPSTRLSTRTWSALFCPGQIGTISVSAGRTRVLGRGNSSVGTIVTFLTGIIIGMLTSTWTCVTGRTRFTIQKISNPALRIISSRGTWYRCYGRLVLGSIRTVVANWTFCTFTTILEAQKRAKCSNRACVLSRFSSALRTIIPSRANLSNGRSARAVHCFRTWLASFDSTLVSGT